MALLKPELPLRRSTHVPKPSRGPSAIWVALTGAIVVSVIATSLSMHFGDWSLYKDAVSHMAIARRVLLGSTPGIGQFGAVWLPFPHMLMLPFVWNDYLYTSGLAGAIPSMICYVVTVGTIYKIVYDFTKKRSAGYVGAAVFGLSFSVLFLQTTAMTEPSLFCLMALSVFFVQRWAQTGQTRSLIAASFSLFFASLTRYEAWIFVVLMVAAVGAILFMQPLLKLNTHLKLKRASDRIFLFGIPAIAGVVGWVFWNLISYNNPLYFLNSGFAKPALDPVEPARGHMLVAVQTYGYAMVETTGPIILALGLIGLIVFVVREFRGRAGITRALPVLTILPVLAFFVYTIYTGQRPLHVVPINGEGYNVRYGLVSLLPAAIFIGYLVGAVKLRAFRLVLAGVMVLAVASSGVLQAQRGVNSLVGIEHATTASNEVAAYVKSNYDGGKFLMQSWYNENIAYSAIPSNELIYEGSTDKRTSLWNLALGSPDEQGIKWIISRCGAHADLVCTKLNPDQLAAHYVLVKTVKDKQLGDVFRIYRHN